MKNFDEIYSLTFVFSGLLGGHISARYINMHYPPRLSWYRDELLVLAHDLGTRLLPAFNTTSGLPLPRVNLRHGIDLTLSKSEREKFTCTACAGTLILEWATLSRLTGNYLFEQYADRALDYLWERRHRQSNLMGTILNVHSGDWIVRESGIGAGIDSYYEYLFKAYVLLGEEKYDYLTRFQEHYSSIMSYVQQGVAMVNVHMHQPYRLAKNHMDALLAFWPGLQVMTGDLKPAIELHDDLNQLLNLNLLLLSAFFFNDTDNISFVILSENCITIICSIVDQLSHNYVVKFSLIIEYRLSRLSRYFNHCFFLLDSLERKEKSSTVRNMISVAYDYTYFS